MRRLFFLSVLCAIGSLSGIAHASGDVFGDCSGCGGGGSGGSFGGGGSGNGNGFTDLSAPLVIGASAGFATSLFYDFPVVVGAPYRKFGAAWHVFGVSAGATSVGFGAATIVNGATVNDGIGGVIFGSVAVVSGSAALIWSIPALASSRHTEQGMQAALVRRGSRWHLGLPEPSYTLDARRNPTPMVSLFAGTL